MEHIIEIDFMRCCRAVFKRYVALLLALVLGFLTGFAISVAFLDHENEYNVYTEVFISDITLVPYCAELLKTSNVAQGASMLLGHTYTGTQINSMIQANYSDNVLESIPVIEICASTRNPGETVPLVDAVTEAYVTELRALMGQQIALPLSETSNVELVYHANKTCLFVTLGTALAFVLLVVGITILEEILALRLSTVKDGLLDGQLKLLGVIPRHKA